MAELLAKAKKGGERETLNHTGQLVQQQVGKPGIAD
jgi:hypothetical protein